jgi:Co/Zn/Cd efflux system component
MLKTKTILNTFAYVTTGVVIGTSIYIKVFWNNPQLSVDIFLQILFVSFLCCTGNLFYYYNDMKQKEGLSRKQFLIRIILHYFYINIIVIGAGLIFEWFYWYRIDMMIAILVMILVIYTCIWFINFQRDKKLAMQLNEKLKEYYKKEE